MKKSMLPILVYALVMFVIGMTFFRYLEANIASTALYLFIEFVIYMLVAVICYFVFYRKK